VFCEPSSAASVAGVTKLARAANAPEDSPARSQARRALRAITAGAAERVQDAEYRALLQPYGQRGRGPIPDP